MEFSKLLGKRRSYRSLEKVEIDEETIKKLAEAAGLAPSCYNNQPWRFVFVHDESVLNKMFDTLSEGNAWAKNASMMITIVSKKDYDCLMPDGREYYQFDTGMAVMILMLKATELGLVAHPIAGYDPDKVKSVLNIPSDIEVITLLIIGKRSDELNPILKDYQIESEKNRPKRKELNEFIYMNKYR